MVDARIEELKTLLPNACCPIGCGSAGGSRGFCGTAITRSSATLCWSDCTNKLKPRLLCAKSGGSTFRKSRIRRNFPSLRARMKSSPRSAAHQVVVIAGETGSGKTTQIPKMCLEAGLGIEAKIGCTQPRRVAALSISRRIAEELNVTWGREVGCKIRFDDRSSAQTYIKLMTDGILLAETQGDPDLAEYNAIILDEAHERSLNIDFLLGHLKGLLARRKDLKLIITSATIDTEAFSRHFDNAPIIEVSGRRVSGRSSISAA